MSTWLVALAWVLASAADPVPADSVAVETVAAGFAAHDAGLRPGDVVVGWERAASPPANPEPASGEVHSR